MEHLHLANVDMKLWRNAYGQTDVGRFEIECGSFGEGILYASEDVLQRANNAALEIIIGTLHHCMNGIGAHAAHIVQEVHNTGANVCAPIQCVCSAFGISVCVCV